MKTLRVLHLYLGCFFAPLLLFFVITGAVQTLQLHQQMKNSSYKPPEIVKSLSEVHIHQRFTGNDVKPNPSFPFKLFVLGMSLGLAITTVLGVTMAFRVNRPAIVWLCLILGTVIPALLLWWARGFK